MGGVIDVKSEMGKGSLFRVQLPMDIAEAADVQERAVQLALGTGDEKAFREVIKEAVQARS